jgi:tRNA-splicing ligase RtcB (3'-phosphate/5'-hydroxy nucleic acid ligase)
MRVIKKDYYNLPAYIWATNVEETAQEQIDHVNSLPFLASHTAYLPDLHAGFGLPIGTVIACDGVVIPNAVGVN